MIDPKDIVFEPEGTPSEPQEDAVYVIDGRGRMVKLEVDDDVADS